MKKFTQRIVSLLVVYCGLGLGLGFTIPHGDNIFLIIFIIILPLIGLCALVLYAVYLFLKKLKDKEKRGEPLSMLEVYVKFGGQIVIVGVVIILIAYFILGGPEPHKSEVCLILSGIGGMLTCLGILWMLSTTGGSFDFMGKEVTFICPYCHQQIDPYHIPYEAISFECPYCHRTISL